jgi:hypothetical protein
VRTTLDIADDVLYAAKEVARRDKKTLGQIVSELMRRGLSSPTPLAADAASGKDVDSRLQALGCRTLPPRGGIVTNELIDRLREQEGV